MNTYTLKKGNIKSDENVSPTKAITYHLLSIQNIERFIAERI